MTLLLPPLSFVSSPPLSSSSSSSSSSSRPLSSSPFPTATSLLAIAATAAGPISRLPRKSFILQPGFFGGLSVTAPIAVCGKRKVMVSASSDIDGKDASGPETPKEGSEESVSVQNLPLESKLQEKLEQKLRMKMAKKIRLRRKRLVRKRRMRKKGRWPPSKMKKNKNV